MTVSAGEGFLGPGDQLNKPNQRERQMTPPPEN